MPEGAVDPLGIYSEKLLNKPVVMAVQGICLTIGIELLPDLLPLMQSKDVQEGIAAFVERREARFKGE